MWQLSSWNFSAAFMLPFYSLWCTFSGMYPPFLVFFFLSSFLIFFWSQIADFGFSGERVTGRYDVLVWFDWGGGVVGGEVEDL